MSTLSGKVVLVTGASRGIGAVLAQRFAEQGAKVIVNYAGGKEQADQVVDQIRKKKGDAITLQADVSKAADVKNLFDEGIARFGKIDVLVNNAGINTYKLIKDTTDDDFTRLFEINVRGTFNTLREAATKLADKGSIINFSSTVNRIMLPTYGIYVASKSAVEQLTRILAKELGSRGINVNSVSPGPVGTELFLKGKTQETINHLASLSTFNRLGTPDDIANVVLYLASDEAKWINAQNIGANGGMA